MPVEGGHHLTCLDVRHSRSLITTRRNLRKGDTSTISDSVGVEKGRRTYDLTIILRPGDVEDCVLVCLEFLSLVFCVETNPK